MSYQSDHVVERARLLEFFTKAAELLEFDSARVAEILQDPWNREAASYTNALRQTRHPRTQPSLGSMGDETACDYYGQVDDLANESLYSATDMGASRPSVVLPLQSRNHSPDPYMRIQQLASTD